MSESPETNAKDDALLPLVYDQLRRAAQIAMQRESPGHSLQATALVHEAFVKLSEGRKKPWANEAHYYAAAAEAMRRLLIDHARAKNAAKRGGGEAKAGSVARISEPGLANVADLARGDSEEIVRFDEAFLRLEAENSEAAAVVRLRFFAGLSVDQTAAALDLSPATVDRRWTFAKAWLHRALTEPPAQAGG